MQELAYTVQLFSMLFATIIIILKSVYWMKKNTIALIVFFQYFVIWIYCLDRFSQKFYLLLNSFIDLFVKEIYWYFYRKLIAVIFMFIQSFHSKQMTLALIIFLIICNGDIEINPGRNRILKFPFVTGI